MAFLEHKKLFEASRTFIDVLYIYTAMILHIIQRCYKPVNDMKNSKMLTTCVMNNNGTEPITENSALLCMVLADLTHVYPWFQFYTWPSKLSLRWLPPTKFSAAK